MTHDAPPERECLWTEPSHERKAEIKVSLLINWFPHKRQRTLFLSCLRARSNEVLTPRGAEHGSSDPNDALWTS
jgi:hypothetical protein